MRGGGGKVGEAGIKHAKWTWIIISGKRGTRNKMFVSINQSNENACTK